MSDPSKQVIDFTNKVYDDIDNDINDTKTDNTNDVAISCNTYHRKGINNYDS